MRTLFNPAPLIWVSFLFIGALIIGGVAFLLGVLKGKEIEAKVQHILTDRERLRDPDGEDFPTIAEASEEATQRARDIIAEELRLRSCRSLAMEHPDHAGR